MKTLKDIAGLYKSLVQNKLTSGPTRAYKTGNLYNRISSFNKAENMVSELKSGKSKKYIITINIAPDGAIYGKYVHDGTVYMLPRPFAEVAANDPQMSKAVSELVKTDVGLTIDVMNKQMNEKFREAGFKIT
jgi:hypothetical protein